MTTESGYSPFPGAGDVDVGVDPNLPGAAGPAAVYNEPVGFGWIAFASYVFLIAGVFNIIDGIVALLNGGYLSNQLVVGNLVAWGWAILILGILQLIVSCAILAGSTIGTFIGIALTSLNLIAQMLFVRTAPFWSLLIIAMNVVVLYGLVVYGGRRHRLVGVA